MPTLIRDVLRRWRLALAYAALLVAAGSLATAQNLESTGPGGPSRLGASALRDSAASSLSSSASNKPAERIREGTRLIDEVGTFQSVGDRVSFLPGGNKEALRVLENLALERIDRTLGESGNQQRPWIISGVITEFKGANYLLVSKAQLQEAESADNR
jgi:hypothetical protein